MAAATARTECPEGVALDRRPRNLTAPSPYKTTITHELRLGSMLSGGPHQEGGRTQPVSSEWSQLDTCTGRLNTTNSTVS